MSAAVKEAPAEEKPSSKMEVDNIDEDEDEGKFWLIFHKQICRAIWRNFSFFYYFRSNGRSQENVD